MTRRTLILLTLIIVISLSLLIQQWLLVDLPDPTRLYQHTSAPLTKIFDRHGTLLYEITDPHQGLHTPLARDDIPLACREATIATEDASFYQNPGVDLWAIIRAVYINVQGGEILSGGSTITQQLARNLLLSPQERREVSLTRKLREAILAWRIARRYSKDDILTLYLNETYYGNLAYGLEAASRTYFGKSARQLDLAECALLVGLPQSPANYNPLENLTAAKARQATVLDLLLKQGYITEAEANGAKREKLGFAAVPFPIKAPHFVMFVRGELERQFGLAAIYRDGLQVRTTLDLDMQTTAQRLTQHHLAELTKPVDGLPPRDIRNSATVVLDPTNGQVLAMLGSPDYFDSEIDGAVNATVANRQPGSSIKPLTYAAAFDPHLSAEFGYAPLTPASMMLDVPTAFTTQEGQPYRPQNYDRVWRGPVLLRQSLASSYNLVAVKLLDYIGLDTLIELARRSGISTFDHKRFGLALTLGGGEVKLLELTAAYAMFANGGQRVEPYTIQRVTDASGQLRYAVEPPTERDQILDPRTAYLITDILSDNHARRSTFGGANPLRLTRPAAAKTGTTQDWRDNWTVGYSPQLVVGVWTGNADNQPMRNVSGVTGAAPIWRDIMEELHKIRPNQPFPRPTTGLTQATVCSLNGLLPQPLTPNPQSLTPNPQSPIPCPHTLTEHFLTNTEPTTRDDWHQRIALDRRNGLRAGPDCPLDFVTWHELILYPAGAQNWARQRGLPQPPEQYSPLCPADADGAQMQAESVALTTEPISRQTITTALVISSPDQGAVMRRVASIPADKQKVRISVQPNDGVRVESVSLLHNGQLLAETMDILWQLEVGTHTFEAVGTDINGQTVRSQVVQIEVVE